MSDKVNFYIDGLNVYHRIHFFWRKTREDKNYKWLDYHSFCFAQLKQGETLGDIYLFTSRALHKGKEAVSRHNKLIEALEYKGINVVHGYFNEREGGGMVEKQTDVNIVTQMFTDAIKEECKKMILFSGDNDFEQPLKRIKELYNDRVRMVIMLPPSSYGTHKLESAVGKGNVIKTTFDSFRGHSLPKTAPTFRGVTIRMPPEYKEF